MTARLLFCACFLLASACTRDNPLAVPEDGGVLGNDAGHDLGKDKDAGGSTCSKITDEASCRARTDCVADTCFACSCTPAFSACRAPSEPATVCPGLGCPSPICCHDTSDCSSFGLCLVPPIGPGCGICNPEPSSCDKDADCKLGASVTAICATSPCSCTGNTKSCQAGCTGDTDCGEPERCDTDHHCKPRPCDSTCTGNYACSSGTCARKACTSDAQCGAPGYCIDHLCSRSYGQCVQPAA